MKTFLSDVVDDNDDDDDDDGDDNNNNNNNNNYYYYYYNYNNETNNRLHPNWHLMGTFGCFMLKSGFSRKTWVFLLKREFALLSKI